jgi:protoheme IX farnesyltransferase
LSGAPGRDFSTYARLCKVGIALLASGSALAVAVLASPRTDARLLGPWLGVFLLACGAGALNQAQEWRIDARMERTKRRPVPSMSISPGRARALAWSLMAAGLLVLASVNPIAALLGAFAVVWYNGVYTRLKKISPFAAVPGALTGAIPPAIGWVGAGRSLADSRVLMLCLLLFIWQIPHFWLILLDRAGDYKRAGLPALTDFFSDSQIRRILAPWILGTSACSLLLSLSGLVYDSAARYALLAVSLWLGYQGIRFRLQPARESAKLFRCLNIFLVLVLLLLGLGRHI